MVTRCIFCKSSKNSFESVEHIVPESVGNMEHALPKGIVCDSCNNYFARKLESIVLSSGIILDIRNKMNIPNKRGKIPPKIENDAIQLPDKRIFARFLGKVAMEVLAQRALTDDVLGWEHEVIDNPGLDDLRNFVRYNQHHGEWSFVYRTLHPIDAVFEENEVMYELLHEYQLLYTDERELYLILSLFGVEFAFNMGGPEIDGYLEWLEQNEYLSPLYSRKKSQ